jgi:hypothetical protein
MLPVDSIALQRTAPTLQGTITTWQSSAKMRSTDVSFRAGTFNLSLTCHPDRALNLSLMRHPERSPERAQSRDPRIFRGMSDAYNALIILRYSSSVKARIVSVVMLP